MNEEDWAFNYWVLDKIYSVEETFIESQIIDDKDEGIDCYHFDSDGKELYLIQNKYYGDNSTLSLTYVKNVLSRSIAALENNTYPKCQELQLIFNENKNKKEFKIFFDFYVTNNKRNYELIQYVQNYNTNNKKNIEVRVYYLEDIAEKFYNELFYQTDKIFKSNIYVSSNNQVLDMYDSVNEGIPCKYVSIPVYSLYRLYREAIDANYPLFDKNIRDYLGKTTTVNKEIAKTLNNPKERKYFFYYNNGITVFCTHLQKSTSLDYNNDRYFKVENPKIVNGCQTVSTISTVMREHAMCDEDLKEIYKDCYVLVKFLKIDYNDDTNSLASNVVKYNNSQNSIDQKTFVAVNDLFVRYQREFEKRGFLLKIKQSDEVTFKEKYKSQLSMLLSKNKKYSDKFLLDIKNVKDCIIKLDKFLTVMLAFALGGQAAYVKKSDILKPQTETYKMVTQFLMNNTVETVLNIYMLYYACEKAKKTVADDRFPISYYNVDLFALYECSNRDGNKVLEVIENTNINGLIKKYEKITRKYTEKYLKTFAIDYNKMIKRAVEYEIANDIITILTD